MKKQKIRYISIKLPASIEAYPLDKVGCRKLPNYTRQYLRKHGKKLFDILLNEVPSDLYSELVEHIKQRENL